MTLSTVQENYEQQKKKQYPAETVDRKAEKIQSQIEENVDETIRHKSEDSESFDEPNLGRAMELITGKGDITPEDVSMIISLSKKLVEVFKQLGVTEFTKEKILELSKNKYMLSFNDTWNAIRAKGDGWIEKAVLACPPFPPIYVMQVCLHLGLLDCEEKHFDDLMKRTGFAKDLVLKVGTVLDEKFRAYLKFLRPLGELPNWVNSVDRKVRDQIRQERREQTIKNMEIQESLN